MRKNEFNPHRLEDYLFVNDEVKSKKHVSANFTLQLIADAMATAVDIPMRILDFTALEVLPKTIYDLRNDKD